MIGTFWFVRLDEREMAEERSLEMTEVLREGGRRWRRQELPKLWYFHNETRQQFIAIDSKYVHTGGVLIL